MDAYVSPQELYRQLQADHPPTVIDVRGDDEYAAGHMERAGDVPGDQLSARLDEIPGDRPVVPY
jgi:rhodanese-related sulfurtransferase